MPFPLLIHMGKPLVLHRFRLKYYAYEVTWFVHIRLDKANGECTDNQCRCYFDSNRRVGDRRYLRTLVNQSKASSSKDQATEIGEPQEASPSSVTIEAEHISLD